MNQKKITTLIRKLGYKVTTISASSYNRMGIPDILIAIEGVPVFLEIKIGSDKLSKAQKQFLDEFFFTTFVLHYDPKNSKYSCIHSKKLKANESYLFMDITYIVNSLNDLAQIKSKRKSKISKNA